MKIQTKNLSEKHDMTKRKPSQSGNIFDCANFTVAMSKASLKNTYLGIQESFQLNSLPCMPK